MEARKKSAKSRKRRSRTSEFVQDFLPVREIRNGIIETTDDRYVKIIEILPINFLLRSSEEQYNIISSFASWLKISPMRLQFKSVSRKADSDKHVAMVREELSRENDPQCRQLGEEYLRLIKDVGNKEALSRRFFLIFQYEPPAGKRNSGESYADIYSMIQTAVQNAKTYFMQCGNAIVQPEDENVFTAEVLYMFSMEKLPGADFVAWNRMLDVFVKSADFGPQKIMFRSKKTDDAHTAPMHLVSLYDVGDKQVMLPADMMESRGTIKLVDFAIPFVERFAKGGVFVIDEFDSAIHPELVKGIIALFNDPNVNKEGAQLVFTTHNPIYLNNKMFRRDQILFVEKDRESYRSVLYSLADFGSADVRNDQNYLINYFKGKYGALPYIDFAGLLKQPSGEEKP